MKNSDKPAYPVGIKNNTDYIIVEGMTRREVFAMAAMQGLLSNSKLWENLEQVDDAQYHTWFAEQSVIYADELLKQLDTNP